MNTFSRESVSALKALPSLSLCSHQSRMGITSEFLSRLRNDLSWIKKDREYIPRNTASVKTQTLYR